MAGYDRDFLKAGWGRLEGFVSDQSKGINCPPMQKAAAEGAVIVQLPGIGHEDFRRVSLDQAFSARRSVRKYTDEPLSLEELTWLLWSTQGVWKTFRNGTVAMRTVPSAGARHPFETYLVVRLVEGLERGIYRYLPFDGALVREADYPGENRVSEACLGQEFCGNSAVCFFWTVIPYRTEWRYGPVSPKIIALDAGHLCQNLYLACEETGAGTCAIGAYDQDLSDRLIDVDGTDEFVVYIAPVGKVSVEKG
jgi:SagB-type dehydrogenase family enzyme